MVWPDKGTGKTKIANKYIIGQIYEIRRCTTDLIKLLCQCSN